MWEAIATPMSADSLVLNIKWFILKLLHSPHTLTSRSDPVPDWSIQTFSFFFSFGVLSLILSGPRGLTCDGFHITQPQRSRGRPIPRSDRNALIWRFITGRYFCVGRERWMMMWWSAIDGVLVAADDTLVTCVSSDLRLVPTVWQRLL